MRFRWPLGLSWPSRRSPLHGPVGEAAALGHASKTEPLTIIGLAAAVLALEAVHWLVRDQDRKDTQSRSDGPV